MQINDWSIVYEKAIKDDGELFFPERLNLKFLDQAKKVQGTIIFANQYLNEVFPAEDAKFKKDWFKYTLQIPENVYTFAFIDPAISTKDGADYTGIVVVSVDAATNWYVLAARRERLTPTQIVNLVFEIQNRYKCMTIGIETVAYQKALLYMLDEEMRKRQMILPVTGVNRGPKQSKEMRILGLVPRYEWGRIYHVGEQPALERELLQFPRGEHDDVIDSAASLESIITYPAIKKENLDAITNPHDPRYESALIRRLVKQRNDENS